MCHCGAGDCVRRWHGDAERVAGKDPHAHDKPGMGAGAVSRRLPAITVMRALTVVSVRHVHLTAACS